MMVPAIMDLFLLQLSPEWPYKAQEIVAALTNIYKDSRAQGVFYLNIIPIFMFSMTNIPMLLLL